VSTAFAPDLPSQASHPQFANPKNGNGGSPAPQPEPTFSPPTSGIAGKTDRQAGCDCAWSESRGGSHPDARACGSRVHLCRAAWLFRESRI